MERTYKLRRAKNDGGYAYSLGVPPALAKQLEDDEFVCELTGRCLVFRPPDAAEYDEGEGVEEIVGGVDNEDIPF